MVRGVTCGRWSSFNVLIFREYSFQRFQSEGVKSRVGKAYKIEDNIRASPILHCDDVDVRAGEMIARQGETGRVRA